MDQNVGGFAKTPNPRIRGAGSSELPAAASGRLRGALCSLLEAALQPPAPPLGMPLLEPSSQDVCAVQSPGRRHDSPGAGQGAFQGRLCTCWRVHI